MKTRTRSILAAGALASALFMGSPALMADDHGKMHHGDKQNIEKMCENFKEGKGRFDREERKEKMAERLEATAERLKLNDEQRKIWNDIHEERHEKHEKRMKKWHEKMEKRCAEIKE
ncbi:hypothetical protein [Marinobacter sp. F3R08]|uniref:hypothetical protein n=1 Tax=Marinobacter sp. F3R08 TaxID=2841559 RepID=UPI001C08DFD9|nr:hypothetical protein [Marinobacter sp. F3R08]MBU2953868.1 hypothetical protein [Marinobacter sp. F3R08]